MACLAACWEAGLRCPKEGEPGEPGEASAQDPTHHRQRSLAVGSEASVAWPCPDKTPHSLLGPSLRFRRIRSPCTTNETT